MTQQPEQTPQATYSPGTAGKDLVRLLLSDVSAPWVFADAEIAALLELEGGNVRRAAATAIDTQATNEALAAKVLRDHQLSTDGAKLADAMRKHAAALRDQADRDEAREQEKADDDAFFFGVVDLGTAPAHPELTQYPAGPWGW